VYGDFRLIYPRDEKIFAIARQMEQEITITILNFTDSLATFHVPAEERIDRWKGLELKLSNYDDAESRLSDTLLLRPYEGRLYGGLLAD
jgi:hypothetical protein